MALPADFNIDGEPKPGSDGNETIKGNTTASGGAASAATVTFFWSH